MNESLLSLDELLSGVKGTVFGNTQNVVFTNVATDSRNVCENTLFVPLRGEFQNGHKYVPQAVEKGASVVFVNEYEFSTNEGCDYKKLCLAYPYLTIVIVKNTLTALQDAAEAYVSKFPELIKISITGSCGKTTTKELLVSVFKAKYGDKVVYTKGNFNSETGLPLSVFNIRKEHEIGIFEMGMNRENEIGEISKVLKSNFGIITNIGNAHIGILGSRENIAKEKRKSFAYINAQGAAFVPADDDFADYCTENVTGSVVKYGSSVDSNISGVSFIEDCGLLGTKFSVDGIEITLPLSGNYNYQNALGVIACARCLGISAEQIKSGIENMSAVSGRMESSKVTLNNGCEVILIKDYYNANPDSMGKVIDFCKKLNQNKASKNIYVLGDMKELGAQSVQSHENIGIKINDEKNAFTFLIGPEMKAAYNKIENKEAVIWTEKNDENAFAQIAAKINEIAKNDDVILLKGSHSMALENLAPLLQEVSK